MTKSTKKGLAVRIGAIAACAALAVSAVGIGSFAKYHQVIGFAGTDGDGTNPATTPRVASFFFTGNVTKNGHALTTDDLKNGVSLFSTAYSGATGTGTAKGTEGNTVEAKDTTAVVAPGTHGSAGIAMEAGDGTDPTKSYAETDAIISLDLQMKSGANADSRVPLIIGIDTNADGKNDAFYSDVLPAGVYKFNDPTGLGREANLASGSVTIAGDFADLADATEVYYFANGNAFYEIDEETGKGDRTKPVNKGTAYEGKLNYNITWYWAYEMSDAGEDDVTAHDASDTALGNAAYAGLTGNADAAAAAQVKLTFAANAVQVD